MLQSIATLARDEGQSAMARVEVREIDTVTDHDCGATYATEVWTLWHATYWLSGAIAAITAMAALPTAVLLVRLVPEALALPTPEAMRPEFADHGRVEQSLSKASSDLKLRVQRKAEEPSPENGGVVS